MSYDLQLSSFRLLCFMFISIILIQLYMLKTLQVPSNKINESIDATSNEPKVNKVLSQKINIDQFKKIALKHGTDKWHRLSQLRICLWATIGTDEI